MQPVEHLRARFARLAHAWTADQPPAAAVCGQADTPAGADVVQIWLTVHADRISHAVFRAHGGPATLCAADWVCETVTGGSVDAAMPDAAAVLAALDLPRVSMPAALLAVDALNAALRQSMAANPAPAAAVQDQA